MGFGINAELPKRTNVVSSIADETPGLGVRTPVVDRGNCMASRQRDELFALVMEECIVGDEQRS